MNNKSKFIPNAWEYLGKKYYVSRNDPNASDDNSGTEEQPFKTISKAAEKLKKADVLFIGEGIYREEVVLHNNGHRYMPETAIQFRGEEGKEVYLKGSDVFNPEWTRDGQVFTAALPLNLFKDGTYNPYELNIDVNEKDKKVRPIDEGKNLPLTLGQIYLDSKPYEQVGDYEELLGNEMTFLVSADGKNISVHCPDGKSPQDFMVELTVRRRCIKPIIQPAIEPAHIFQTMGIVIEHAAEPGPFCKCRPVSVRTNRDAGITVTKRFNVNGTTTGPCGLFSQVSYKDSHSNTLVTAITDDCQPYAPESMVIFPASEAESEDGGRTWILKKKAEYDPALPRYNYFFDMENGVLTRHYFKKMTTDSGMNHFDRGHHIVNLEYSYDEGKSWTAPQVIADYGFFFKIEKLKDGTFLWLYVEKQEQYSGAHTCVKSMMGRWNSSKSIIEWESGGMLETTPEKSSGGLAEPHWCQLQDGRVFLFMRQGAILPSQNHHGTPSVKLCSISEDNGRTWSEPVPLTYDDGSFVYSPRSYQEAFTSTFNGKSYVMLNISPVPTQGCDPRTELYIGEIDPQNLSLKRKTLAIIDAMHPEHNNYIRYSNFQIIEEVKTRKLLLFMKLHMAAACPIRRGYDCASYLYEIELPKV